MQHPSCLKVLDKYRQPQVKAFYEKLIRAGKKQIQASVAVMRKLPRCLWGMLKHQQDFDGSKFYQLT